MGYPGPSLSAAEQAQVNAAEALRLATASSESERETAVLARISAAVVAERTACAALAAAALTPAAASTAILART